MQSTESSEYRPCYVIILPIRTVAFRLYEKFALSQLIWQIHQTKPGRRKIVFDFKMG
jgi:hypothetical protein